MRPRVLLRMALILAPLATSIFFFQNCAAGKLESASFADGQTGVEFPDLINPTSSISFSMQPLSAEILEGQEFDLSAQASGDPAPDVTWQIKQNGRWVDLGNVAGITRNGKGISLRAALTSDRVGTYRAIARNSLGEAVSQEAILKIGNPMLAYAVEFNSPKSVFNALSNPGSVATRTQAMSDGGFIFVRMVGNDGNGRTMDLTAESQVLRFDKNAKLLWSKSIKGMQAPGNLPTFHETPSGDLRMAIWTQSGFTGYNIAETAYYLVKGKTGDLVPDSGFAISLGGVRATQSNFDVRTTRNSFAVTVYGAFAGGPCQLQIRSAVVEISDDKKIVWKYVAPYEGQAYTQELPNGDLYVYTGGNCTPTGVHGVISRTGEVKFMKIAQGGGQTRTSDGYVHGKRISKDATGRLLSEAATLNDAPTQTTDLPYETPETAKSRRFNTNNGGITAQFYSDTRFLGYKTDSAIVSEYNPSGREPTAKKIYAGTGTTQFFMARDMSMPGSFCGEKYRADEYTDFSIKAGTAAVDIGPGNLSVEVRNPSFPIEYKDLPITGLKVTRIAQVDKTEFLCYGSRAPVPPTKKYRVTKAFSFFDTTYVPAENFAAGEIWQTENGCLKSGTRTVCFATASLLQNAFLAEYFAEVPF